MPTQAKSAPTMEPDDDHDDDRDAGGGIDPAALLNDAVQTISAEAKAHPVRTIGIAFAAGYVLGGGVPRFAVRMATAAALRMLGRAVLTSDVVVGLARDALGSRVAAPSAAPTKKRPARKRGN